MQDLAKRYKEMIEHCQERANYYHSEAKAYFFFDTERAYAKARIAQAYEMLAEEYERRAGDLLGE